MSLLKQEIYNLCREYIESRIKTIENAIQAARESSIDDTKSSAGDKYETGREMMQQEIDRNTKQLFEAGKLRLALQGISTESTDEIIKSGSLVFTNFGVFYIAVSAGQLKLNGQDYFAVSASSPIGMQLINLKKGDKFDFNGRNYLIVDVQ
ncbi:MAG: 3-oxoacyl-ACP synthase [Daejeonella sp.]